jgi:[acyl-carrier-protein] S-malonyltransferase
MDAICAEASSSGEIVQVANDNCPGQVVISGASAALDRAVSAAGAGARRMSGSEYPAHSPLWKPLKKNSTGLFNGWIVDPVVPLVGTTAQLLKLVKEIIQDLQGQLAKPGPRRSIQFMQNGIDTSLNSGMVGATD